MALMIRLRKQGRKNRESFRLVLTDKRTPRDGKYLEKLGWYDPFIKDKNVVVNPERVWFWLDQGAEISDKAKALVKAYAPDVIQKLTAKKLEKKSKQGKKEKK